MDSLYRQAFCLRFLGGAQRRVAGGGSHARSAGSVSELARPRLESVESRPDCPRMGAAPGYNRSRRPHLPDAEYSLSARRWLPGGLAVVLPIRSGDWRLARDAGAAVCGYNQGSRAVALIIPNSRSHPDVAVFQADGRISLQTGRFGTSKISLAWRKAGKRRAPSSLSSLP